jgi:hypothetical protein
MIEAQSCLSWMLDNVNTKICLVVICDCMYYCELLVDISYAVPLGGKEFRLYANWKS